MKNQLLTRRSVLRLFGLGGAFAGLAPIVNADQSPKSDATTFNVRDWGARGDGQGLETAAIQAAIDACARGGGGRVLIPAGLFRSGTLLLKSRVTLELAPGAVLQGSADLADYPPHRPSFRSYTDHYTERSLIYGEDLESIAIVGRGCIDGQGAKFPGGYKQRPYLLRLIRCRDIHIQGVTFRDSPMWVQHYLACEELSIEGITVRSRCNRNNDGIDIDGCQRVRIANCDVRSGDDALVFKSTSARLCRDITVVSCVLSSNCNAIKMGTESNGGFQNIAIANCSVYDTRLSGLALEIVDGGHLDGVNISNITMRNVDSPLFIRLGNRARPFQPGTPNPGIGTLRNVMISHVEATGADRIGCAIVGLVGNSVENLTLDHIRLHFAGGGSGPSKAGDVPELVKRYPEYNMFGPLPAYGFYIRHARNVSLGHVQMTTADPDARPALWAEDVERLTVDDCHLQAAENAPAAIELIDVRQGQIYRSGCSPTARVFASVFGNKTRQIRISDNALDPATRAADLAANVTAQAVRVK